MTTQVAQLRRQLKAYVNQAYQNERKQRQFQDQELQFIGASGITELVDTLLYDFRRNFELQWVTLLLHDPQSEIRHIMEQQGLLGQHNDLVLCEEFSEVGALIPESGLPVLGKCSDECAALLFQNSRPSPSSVAILPLFRSSVLIGTLNLGSDKPERYIRGAATDFLQRLAGIVAVCFENALNQERLRLIGLLDPLTGIHNRRYFDQRLDEEVARTGRSGTQLSCLFLDIDHFKSFNDRFGHAVGDQVLRTVADVVKLELRASDILARFGGEEFSVLLIDMDPTDAAGVAERIRHTVAETRLCLPGDHNSRITLSIGCATLDGSGSTPPIEEAGQDLLERADKALYQAKATGRDRVCFD